MLNPIVIYCVEAYPLNANKNKNMSNSCSTLHKKNSRKK